MKKVMILALAIILMTTMVSANMSLDLNVSTTQDLDADIKLNAGGNINLDIDVHGGSGDLWVNETYNMYVETFESTEVVRKTMNRKGILLTLVDMFQMYFGEQEIKRLDKEEYDYLNYLHMYRQSIIDEIQTASLTQMQLELRAQKEINAQLSEELRWIHEAHNRDVNTHSLECSGYLRVMLEEGSPVESITCNQYGVNETWIKQWNGAVQVNPTG